MRLAPRCPASFVIALASVALSSGCAPDATPMVRVQAASDMVCAEEQVRVQHSSGSAYDAYGCGKHIRYFAACQGSQCVVTRHGRASQNLHPRPRPLDPTPAPRP